MMVTDGAAEFTSKQKEFGKHARRMRMKLHVTEQGRSNQNHAAEREIGYLSRRWKMEMGRKKVPKRLWDFGLVYQSELWFPPLTSSLSFFSLKPWASHTRGLSVFVWALRARREAKDC